MEAYVAQVVENRTSERFARIKRELLSTPINLCPERAYLITDFFKRYDDPQEPMMVRKAKALRHLLLHKSVRIYPDELIAGNVGSARKSAIIQPECAGVFMAEEILWMDRRKTTPFLIPWRDRLKLLCTVFPYWLTRNLSVRAFSPHFGEFLRFVVDELKPAFYLINEAGGIGHFLPNYEKMLKLGVRGYLSEMEGGSGDLHRAARIVTEGLVTFARRLSDEAASQAAREPDPQRAGELKEIARICAKVPNEPAETFHEALQSLWLTHLAVSLEGLPSAVSFGRIDQYLYPYYRNDLDAGRITPEAARELLLCFSAKATEHVFLLSQRTSEYHGGFLVAQAAMVGGMDAQGADATNALTWIILDAMEASGLREPNYQARVHARSPRDYLMRVADVVRKGNGMPAVFGDEAIVASFCAHGYPVEEARNYSAVGCAELGLPGKSFFSTDASLFNIPICLELALNHGRRLNRHRRVGAQTPDPLTFSGMNDVMNAFRAQLEQIVEGLVGTLQVIERGNRDYHPTPLSSLLVDGCIESGKDVTAGGALYNGSGILCVGLADTADSLAALDEVVFRRRRYTIAQVLEGLRTDFASDPKLKAELLSAPKYGNDESLPDGYAREVARMIHQTLSRYTNTRGGAYVPGYISTTGHVGFGAQTAALPSGRKAGEPFAPSLGPSSGRDRRGPTALLNSAAHIEPELIPMGCAVTLHFDPHSLADEKGTDILAALMGGYFATGGMQMQLNVLDPTMLEDARSHPGKYPGLVVRVAGYCAYFDDLPDSTKREIIGRTRHELR